MIQKTFMFLKTFITLVLDPFIVSWRVNRWVCVTYWDTFRQVLFKCFFTTTLSTFYWKVTEHSSEKAAHLWDHISLSMIIIELTYVTYIFVKFINTWIFIKGYLTSWIYWSSKWGCGELGQFMRLGCQIVFKKSECLKYLCSWDL